MLDFLNVGGPLAAWAIKTSSFNGFHSFIHWLSSLRSQVDPKPLLEAISLKEVSKQDCLTHKHTNPREVRMVVDQAILLRSRNPLLHALPFSRGRPFAAHKQYLIFSLAHSVAPARTKTKATAHFFLTRPIAMNEWTGFTLATGTVSPT